MYVYTLIHVGTFLVSCAIVTYTSAILGPRAASFFLLGICSLVSGLVKGQSESKPHVENIVVPISNLPVFHLSQRELYDLSF